MENLINKDEIESIVLQSVLAGAYKEFGGCRIYLINKTGEEVVIKNLCGTREVETLSELENAVNTPEVSQIYIGKYASITAKGLKNVLSRASLTKNIFCAFEIKE